MRDFFKIKYAEFKPPFKIGSGKFPSMSIRLALSADFMQVFFVKIANKNPVKNTSRDFNLHQQSSDKHTTANHGCHA